MICDGGFMTRPRHAIAVPALAMLLTGCNISLSNRAEARDHWTRSYPITAAGTLEVKSGNGKIFVTPSNGKTIEVDAERVVSASTDEAAKAALAEMKIGETVAPDKIALDATANSSGMSFNLSRRVDFTIKVPPSINVTLKATNGEIGAEGIAGMLTVDTSNGQVHASGLEGGASVQATNGEIRLEFAKLGDQPIRVETSNGAITVRLPKDGNARLSARVTNGVIETGDLPLKILEQSRRRVDATLGSGGPDVRLETTNGLISLKSR
jgi:hypothetical protein